MDAASSGPTVSADVYGAELGTWYDFRRPFVNPSFAAANVHLIRFPGGSESDLYHWENGGTICDPNQGYVYPPATFDNVMRDVAAPLSLDFAITLDYGSNPACNGGGDPAEAAAWVAYSKSKGYAARYWTVGNEVYGSWEYDLHSKPHDPVTYSNAVRTGFYPAVKAADASAQLGVVVDTPDDATWNDVVLSQAKPFDFVELHYYPQYVQDSDAFLLGPAITNFVSDLAGLRKQMTAAGVAASVPIYLGEFNNDAGQEGKQSLSIVNGLFNGEMLGSLINAGVPRATWWLAYGSCDASGGDYSKSLYGWQNFGSEAMFSDGLPSAVEGCPNVPKIPGGTPFPSGRTLALFSRTAPAGSKVRTVSVPASLGTSVRAYGFSTRRGYAMIFFNNTLASIAVTARIDGASRSSFRAELATYGKAQYDKTKQNRWVGPATQELGSVSSSVLLTLLPYSMTALTLR